MLRIDKLNVHIQKTPILRDVTLHLGEGKLAGLIGRNGAGKTTLLRTAMGLMQPVSGSILCGGRDMAGVPAHARVKLHVGYMPEDRRLIPELTVQENILVPAWSGKLPDSVARLAWIYELMPEVAAFRTRRALQLSGGQQKLVALARALMCGTRLLLLDEPFEGVAPALSRRLAEVLHTLKTEGLSVLLSESDYSHSAGLVDQVFVIERGQVAEKNLP
jgi:branched-chain amino acid transport system ATP-binding protein